jgi:lipoate-protein ligase A
LTTEYCFIFGFAPALSGFSNMEIDRFLGEVQPPRLPVVRFYIWEGAIISYGLNQNPIRRLKIEMCLADGIGIVARPTGGREILHGWDLCCSVIWPIDRKGPAVEFRELFNRINGILGKGLSRMGITAECHSVTKKTVFKDGPCFSQIDRGEISVSGRKIVASAQRIYENTVLQQSSISIKKPARDIVEYLNTRREAELREEIVNSNAYLEEVVQETFSMAEIVEVFKGAFEAEMGKSGKFNLPEIF